MKGRLEKETSLLGVKIEGVSTRCNDLWRVACHRRVKTIIIRACFFNDSENYISPTG